MVLRKSFYIRWSAGRSPQVHEVNPGRDPSISVTPDSSVEMGENHYGFCGRTSTLPEWP